MHLGATGCKCWLQPLAAWSLAKSVAAHLVTVVFSLLDVPVAATALIMQQASNICDAICRAPPQDSLLCPTYVLSLAHAATRRANMAQRLEEAGAAFTLVEGIDASQQVVGSQVRRGCQVLHVRRG